MWYPSSAFGVRCQSTAAPATVSGEHLPNATDLSAQDRLGRRQDAPTREPGDLPSLWSRAGRGASATVEFISTVREPAASRFAPVPHPEV
jgi:hypothetical protein